MFNKHYIPLPLVVSCSSLACLLSSFLDFVLSPVDFDTRLRLNRYCCWAFRVKQQSATPPTQHLFRILHAVFWQHEALLGKLIYKVIGSPIRFKWRPIEKPLDVTWVDSDHHVDTFSLLVWMLQPLDWATKLNSCNRVTKTHSWSFSQTEGAVKD